jgi:hypothetical protein
MWFGVHKILGFLCMNEHALDKREDFNMTIQTPIVIKKADLMAVGISAPGLAFKKD